MIAVIGCGNANRRDDGAGLAVIRRLYAREALRANERVHLLDAGTDGMAVMFAARGCTSLIIVDACRTGVEPGAIFEVPGYELQSRSNHSLNLHDFRWDHALYAGRQIYRENFPKDVIAYLIEAHDLEFGCELSNNVQASATRVADMIEVRILATLRAEMPIASET
ncbi:MAG: hydrogenase maturation protease [Hyphomicrobium sp.]|jgi:hydrogenase maturation protease